MFCSFFCLMWFGASEGESGPGLCGPRRGPVYVIESVHWEDQEQDRRILQYCEAGVRWRCVFIPGRRHVSVVFAARL